LALRVVATDVCIRLTLRADMQALHLSFWRPNTEKAPAEPTTRACDQGWLGRSKASARWLLRWCRPHGIGPRRTGL